MLGAVAGDIIGSVYEGSPIKTVDFSLFSEASRFTDDTVLTIAVADAILNRKDYKTSLKHYGNKYPNAGYGMSFYNWIFSSDSRPYNSWGNGSAMRVSPVGFAFDSEDDVLDQAKKSAETTHNHPEGIKGAQAVALAVYLARSGEKRDRIRSEITNRFGYNLERTIDEIRPGYRFDVSCQGSVPEAIIAFLESVDFEDAVRKGISLGGDSDTIGCISGAIAHAFYGKVPEDITGEVKRRLPKEFIEIINTFSLRFNISSI